MIFDSGSSLCHIPKKSFDVLIKEIMKDHPCRKRDDQADTQYECACDGEDDESFPTITFNIGSATVQHWFQMESMDYIQYQKYSKTCAILIKAEESSEQKTWLMGDPFLRTYYSIYDLENSRIGLVGIGETTKLDESPFTDFDGMIDEIYTY